MKNLQNKNDIKKAFTLTEVLITLVIIGVLATIAIKSSMGHYQDTIMIAKLAKTYQTLGEAFNKALVEHGPIADETLRTTVTNAEGTCSTSYNALKDGYSKNWFRQKGNTLEPNVSTNAGMFQANILPYLPVKSTTKVDRTYSCLTDKSNSSNNCSNMPAIIGDTFANGNSSQVTLRDGTILDIFINNPSCDSNFGTNRFGESGCGYIVADLNGKEAPNTYGIDVFGFLITKYGIYPAGNNFLSNVTTDCKSKDWNNGLTIKDYCIKNYIKDDVATYTPVNGIGCTAWVLYKKNFDYRDKASKDITW